MASQAAQRSAIINELHDLIRSNRSKLIESRTNSSSRSVLTATSELLNAYKVLIMDDLARGCEPSLELCLWDDCFKRTLPYFARMDKDTYERFIDYGIKFYAGMIRDIGMRFDVPFIRNAPRGSFACGKAPVRSSPSQEPIFNMLQKSLIRIGDLMRYQDQFEGAMKIYYKAVYLNPNNGYPFYQMGYTQMQLNCSTADGFLAAVYYFVRAVTVSEPYLPAQREVEDLIGNARGITPQTEVQEFLLSFLNSVKSPRCEFSVLSFVAKLSPLIISSTISYEQLFRILVIALWAWRRDTATSQGAAEAWGKQVSLEIIVGIFNSLLIGADSYIELEAYYALPHLKLVMEWVRVNCLGFNNEVFHHNLNVGALCKFLNRLVLMEMNLQSLPNVDVENALLPEEKKLFGFLPFKKSFEKYTKLMEESDEAITWVRIHRIVKCIDCFTETKLRYIRRNKQTGTYQEISSGSQFFFPELNLMLNNSPAYSSSSDDHFFYQSSSDTSHKIYAPLLASTPPEFEPGLPVGSRTGSDATLHSAGSRSSRETLPTSPLPYKLAFFGSQDFNSEFCRSPTAGVIGRRVSDSFVGLRSASQVSTPDADSHDRFFHTSLPCEGSAASTGFSPFHSIWTPTVQDYAKRTGSDRWA